MAKKKVTKQAPAVEEWTAKEWETAYASKCKEMEKLKDHMKLALQHLTKGI